MRWNKISLAIMCHVCPTSSSARVEIDGWGHKYHKEKKKKKKICMGIACQITWKLQMVSSNPQDQLELNSI